jgi:hypothetical protein
VPHWGVIVVATLLPTASREHGMDLRIFGQPNSIVGRADLLRNERWSDIDLVRFFPWSPGA